MLRRFAVAIGCALILTCLTPVSAFADGPTTVGGTLTQDTTWSAANSPYQVASPVVIPAGVTLTIDPGVSVTRAPTSFSTEAMFRVGGTLRASGTTAEPVTLAAGG